MLLYDCVHTLLYCWLSCEQMLTLQLVFSLQGANILLTERGDRETGSVVICIGHTSAALV